MAGGRLAWRGPRTCQGRLLTLVALVSFVSACGDGGTGPKEERIGAEGGSAILAEGAVSLTIPPDALSDFVTFNATTTGSGPASPLMVPGSQYQVGPEGTTFDRLVTMVLSYDPAGLPEGVLESELRLFQASGQTWVPTANSSPRPDQDAVTGLVDGLGTFSAMGIPVAWVDLSPGRMALGIGQTHQFAAFGRGGGNEALPERPVTWQSSDPGVASVDEEGLVTGVGFGTAQILAFVEEEQASSSVRVSDCAAQSVIPASECEAILDLYGSVTMGDWQRIYQWIADPDPCEWDGVTCEGGTVTEFRMPGSGGGVIPPTVTDLVNLRVLNLCFSGLTGVVPSNLGELEDLEILYLHSNALTGSLPPELGNLTQLKTLRIDGNDLTGEIPASIGNLLKLDTLRLGNNRLWGSIPGELGNLEELEALSLIGNDLVGSIPPSLGDLTQLEILSIGANQLSGPIPETLGNLATLTTLGLSRNQLTGGVPASLANLVNLELFSLWDNQLSGTVPIEVAILGGLIQQSQKKSDCWWVPPGNEGLTLPDTQAYLDADLDADGKICGLTIGAG